MVSKSDHEQTTRHGWLRDPPYGETRTSAFGQSYRGGLFVVSRPRLSDFVDIMPKIFTVSVAGAILLAGGSVSYHYLYTLPKQIAFSQCVQTYPADWADMPTVTPADLCERGYSLNEVRKLIAEKTRLIAEEYKSHGADIASQSVKEAISEKVRKETRTELGF